MLLLASLLAVALKIQRRLLGQGKVPMQIQGGRTKGSIGHHMSKWMCSCRYSKLPADLPGKLADLYDTSCPGCLLKSRGCKGQSLYNAYSMIFLLATSVPANLMSSDGVIVQSTILFASKPSCQSLRKLHFMGSC